MVFHVWYACERVDTPAAHNCQGSGGSQGWVLFEGLSQVVKMFSLDERYNDDNDDDDDDDDNLGNCGFREPQELC